MNNRRLAQTHIVDADAFNERVGTRRAAIESRTVVIQETMKTAISFVVAAVISFLLLIGVLVAIFGNLHTYLDTTSQLMKLFIQWLVPAAIAAIVLFCVYRASETFVRYIREFAEIDQMRAEAERTRAEAERIRTRTDLDAQGNQLVLDPITERWVLYKGNMREHPALHSMHYSVKTENVGGEPPALSPGDTAKPKIEDLVKLVERNSFEIPMGESLLDNGPVITSIEDVHIRIIGSSRKGKSCLAAAIIDIATQTHDPNVLMVALLDLENKTSRLFEHLDHVAVLDTGHQRIELHARNPRQVAEHLHLIRNEMDRRYSLSEAEQGKLPHILVYIEEFLSLKKHRDLDPKTRVVLMDDLNELAIRALKVGIHLMACAQVDYADEDLKPFNNNFGLNVSFAVRPEAARAAGFVCSDLLSANWESKVPGECVVEGTGCTDLVDAPDYDVKAKLKALSQSNGDRTQVLSLPQKSDTERRWNADGMQMGTQTEAASEARLQHKITQVLEAMASGINTKDAIIDRVWQVKKGKGQGYQEAGLEYEQVMRAISSIARRGMDTEAEGL